MDNRHIIALEIGSSALKLAAASGGSTLTLDAVETVALHGGVRYGRIQNIDEVSDALTRACEAMQGAPGFAPGQITGVYASVGGRSLATVHTTVRLALPEEGPVTRAIIERLEAEAADAVPQGRQMLRVIPLRYKVDKLLTPNPVGAICSRIAAEYTVVHCDPRNIRNIEAVVGRRLGLDICGWSVRPLAIAALCLGDEDTKPGCMLADIGAETSTVAIFKDCALQYIATIPLGSRHITGDLSIGLGITEDEAESIKRRLGTAVSDRSQLTVEQIKIDKFVQARANEIVANIAAHIEFAGYKNTDLGGGIILTGCGSKLKNLGRLLESVSRMRVRKATPRRRIEITDTSAVESDLTDLIALASIATDMALSPEATPCIKGCPEPRTEAKPEPQSRAAVTESPSDTGHELPGADTPPDTDDDHSQGTFRIDGETPALRIEPDDTDDSPINSYDPPEKRHDERDDDYFADDVDDDMYLLDDDDKAEQLRARDEARKAAARRRAERRAADEEARRQRDEARKLREAETRRKKDEDNERKARDKERRQSVLKNKIESLKTSITNLFAEPDDDPDM